MKFARLARTGLRRKGSTSTFNVALREESSNSKRTFPNGAKSATTSNTFSYVSRSVNDGSLWSRGISSTPNYQFRNNKQHGPESKRDDLDLEATKHGEKPRVVVLGTGWAAYTFMKGLDTKIYDVVWISPRNYTVYTPLLPSVVTAYETSPAPACVAKPLSEVQSSYPEGFNLRCYQGSCYGIDTDKHEVYCEVKKHKLKKDHPWININQFLYKAGVEGIYFLKEDYEKTRLNKNPYWYKVAYDKLVIATGAEPVTFGIKGVEKHACFLRDVEDAVEIQPKLHRNLVTWITKEKKRLELVKYKKVVDTSEEERKRLLHFVVVGGGLTGVELSVKMMIGFTGWYEDINCDIEVTLIEPNEILSSFDASEREYAKNQMTKYKVQHVQSAVKEVNPNKVVLSDGTEITYAILIWCTDHLAPSEFVKKLKLPKSPGERIGVDEWLRIPSVEDVFAIGDCAGFLEHTGKSDPPAAIQVAESQGKYLAEAVNKIGKENGGKAFSAKDVPLGDPFEYKPLSSDKLDLSGVLSCTDTEIRFEWCF